MLITLYDHAFFFFSRWLIYTFLIPEGNKKSLNPAAKPAVPTGTPTNDANTEVVT